MTIIIIYCVYISDVHAFPLIKGKYPQTYAQLNQIQNNDQARIGRGGEVEGAWEAHPPPVLFERSLFLGFTLPLALSAPAKSSNILGGNRVSIRENARTNGSMRNNLVFASIRWVNLFSLHPVCHTWPNR